MTESQAVPQPAAQRKKRPWKAIIAAAVIALAALWLVLFLTVGGDFYQTVEEAKAEEQATNTRVGGRVAAGSIVQEGDQVRFVIEGEQGESLDVVYNGPYPERLGPYEEVVVGGSMSQGGTFDATEVLVKCPEKLFPERVTNKVLSGTGLERLIY